MKIFYSVEAYFPHISGVTIVTDRLATHFGRKKEDQVWVVTASASGDFKVEQTHKGYTILRIKSFPNPIRRKIRVSYLAKLEISRVLDKYHPDLIHLQDPLFISQALATEAKERNTPVIATQHSSLAFPLAYLGLPKLLQRFAGQIMAKILANFYNKYLDKFCVKYADLILSSSDYSGKYAKKVYGKTSITNYLGVDLDKYKKIKNVKKENLTISVGVLQPHKGHEFSIRSIGLIPKEKRPKLIIIAALGSKNEKKKLYKLAKKLDVNLEITGYVPDEEFVKLHNKAKLVVIPFIREPSIEPVALACETPIVAVREGGARETIIHNKTGILTNRDEKEFAKAIEYLLDNPEIAENMGKKGRE